MIINSFLIGLFLYKKSFKTITRVPHSTSIIFISYLQNNIFKIYSNLQSDKSCEFFFFITSAFFHFLLHLKSINEFINFLRKVTVNHNVIDFYINFNLIYNVIVFIFFEFYYIQNNLLFLTVK